MKNLTIQIPEEVDEKEIKMMIAPTLCEKGILSSRQAADFAGILKSDFINLVGKYGASIFGETKEDLKKKFDE